MNDGIMYTYDVINSYEGHEEVLFRCARKSKAEYLRDWCEAIEYERVRKCIDNLSVIGHGKLDIERISSNMIRFQDKFTVTESEVIL